MHSSLRVATAKKKAGLSGTSTLDAAAGTGRSTGQVRDRMLPEIDDVAHIAFLARIRRLFAAPSPHLEFIADAFAQGQLQHPPEPMSDQELARAIREFQSMPLSAASLNKLGSRFAARKPER